MVFFADKRKTPISIYKKGTATEKAQAKMNKNVGRAFQGAANIADKYAGGAGARAVINPVISARAKQTQFLFNDRLNRNRTRPEDRGKVAALLGNKSKLVGGNMPVKKTQARAPLQMLPTTYNVSSVTNKPSLINEQPNARRDQELGKMTASLKLNSDGGEKRTFNIGGNTLSYKLSKNDVAIRDSLGAIDKRIKAGFSPNAEQQGRIQTLRQRAGYTRGGTERAPAGGRPTVGSTFSGGGLDVAFGKGIDQAHRKQFIRQSNQIDSRNAENKKRHDALLGKNLDRLQMPKMENTAGMSPRQARDATLRFNARINAYSASMGNKTRQSNVNSMIASRSIDDQTKQMALEQQQNNANMVTAYDNEQDQGKKKDLRQKLISRGIFKQPDAPKTFQETNSDADGNENTTTYAFNPDGTARRAVPEQLAPPPPNPSDRVVGTPYQTRMGKMYWNGKGYVKTKPQVSR